MSLSNLQVEVYSFSEPGKKPLIWDKSKKGTIEIDGQVIAEEYTQKALRFLNWSLHNSEFIKLSTAEYVLVSLSLALAIAKFFPAFYNQMILRTNGPVHQSLYWGTVVVCNVFNYSLLFVAMRGWSIYWASLYLTYFHDSTPYSSNDSTFWVSVCVTSFEEIIIHIVFLVGALIALHGENHSNVPLPTGIAKFIVKISFCFCMCCSCFLKCSTKATQILIMFGLMNFLYRIIMDAITIVFLLFIDEFRAVLISVAFLCISFFVFLIMCVAYVLYFFRSTNMPLIKKILYGSQTMIIMILFPALILLIVMCIMIVFSLNLQGLTGIVTGLIPSAALSAASWYLKKRLENDLSPSDTPSIEAEDGLTVAMNDIERGEEDISNNEIYVIKD